MSLRTTVRGEATGSPCAPPIGLVRPSHRPTFLKLGFGISALVVALTTAGTAAPYVAPPVPFAASSAASATDISPMLIQIGDRPGTGAPMHTSPPAGKQASTSFEIAGLTHFNRGLGKRVTYTDPRSLVLNRSDFSSDVWTIEPDQATMICWADGNSAVFFTFNEHFYAANGKARQFVRFGEGDGILTTDGRLIQVEEPPAGEHLRLVNEIIQAGLKLCGDKSIEEVAKAADKAAEGSDAAPTDSSPPTNEAIINAALAMKGAEVCHYDAQVPAIVAYLVENGVDNDTFQKVVATYLELAASIIGEGGKEFCEEKLLPKFGPGGFAFVSK